MDGCNTGHEHGHKDVQPMEETIITSVGEMPTNGSLASVVLPPKIGIRGRPKGAEMTVIGLRKNRLSRTKLSISSDEPTTDEACGRNCTQTENTVECGGTISIYRCDNARRSGSVNRGAE